MKLIDWDDSFLTHIKSIDSDHMKIRDKINELESIRENKHFSVIFPEKATHLFNDFHQHFTNEEELLQKINYPHIEEHKEDHRLIVEKLYKYSVQLKDDPETSSKIYNKLTHFLVEWFIKHIHTQDLKFSSYIKENGIDLDNLDNK